VRAALAILAVALVAAPGAHAYRNPTAGKAVVLQIAGMHRATVKRNIVYQRSSKLRMDVYRPRMTRGRLPAVLLAGPAARRSGQKAGWAQLIAASGLSAVTFDTRSGASPLNPAQDVQSALAYVRSHWKRLGIDPRRLCTLGFSAPWHLWATMRDPQPWLRCNVAYYEPLDFQSPALGDEFSALANLRRSGGSTPPMLVVEAGRDDSTDRFAAAATEVHADVRVVAYPEGRPGFDVGRRTPRARVIVKQTLRFLKARLARPLPVTESCATDAERSSALRFFASDDTPLVGIVVGSGPRGIVLAHGQNGDFCEWLPYARELAAAGYRVLAYDARGYGLRVDLDMAAAIEAIRRIGAEHVISMGSSMGAIAALIGSASLPSAPAAVVSLSAPASYGPLNALPSVARLQAPTFFGASQQDDPFVGDARSLYAASAATDKRLDILPGAAHGSAMLQDPGFRSRVAAFIAAH
jgi:pimeloyl-ACP methyl ester carboxylesterase/acetyl esterase/lipase